MNALDFLKQYTRIVVDTGQMDEIQRWKPEEATTNPSLLLNAFQTGGMSGKQLVHEALALAKKIENHPTIDLLCQSCGICLGKEILRHLSGRLSIEIDPTLAFDTEKTIQAAQRLQVLAQQAGLDPRRLLIKIAATWEGIQSIHALEVQGIACNGTLIFNEAQALACAQAGATLISPFVGRIYDWYQAHLDLNTGDEDPGVASVKRIFQSLKAQNYPTEIMGASFRNTQQILALTGCDRLTIAPKFLKQLSELPAPAQSPLLPPTTIPKQPFLSEKIFRWQMNQDPMATEKLAEGIRLFTKAQNQLSALLQSYL